MAVAMAHGYGKATGKPMVRAAARNDRVQHAAVAIYQPTTTARPRC